MKIKYTFFITLIFFFATACSSTNIKENIDSSYIISVTDFMDKNDIDETKSIWYLERDPLGNLIINDNRYKIYYLHFFNDKDNIYSCCLDINHSNDETLSKFGKIKDSFELIDSERILANGYKFHLTKKIIIYKIKEIEGCKCGKEKVFKNDVIENFYAPIQLDIIKMSEKEKKIFSKNIDNISKTLSH